MRKNGKGIVSLGDGAFFSRLRAKNTPPKSDGV